MRFKNGDKVTFIAYTRQNREICAFFTKTEKFASGYCTMS